MADTKKIPVSGFKKKGQGGKNSGKSKQGGSMKERKKSGARKAPKDDAFTAETSGNEDPNSMEITDLDPEGAIGEDKVDKAAHEKLLNSIYALDGRKRSVSQVRGTGMASSNVDLLVHSKIESAKIKAAELNLKSKKTQMVPKPLSVFETEKAKRQIARGVMEKDTKKWEPIVNEIRVAPQIKYAERPKGVEMYKAMKPHKFSPRTPLEVELYEALGKSEDIITPDQPLTKAEERALKAMSVKEAMARRRELLMHNELLFRSQKEGKRQNKIKSKRYRRGIRMEKIAKTKKTLEEMEKTDPEAYFEKLEKVDEARMEERLTLRHKSGGKFARYHKAFSKYDDSAREAIQEMVRKGKELSQKRQIESSDEEEEEMPVDSFISNIGHSDELSNDKSKKGSDLNTKHLEMMKSISQKAGGWLDGSARQTLRDNKSSLLQENNITEGESEDVDADFSTSSSVQTAKTTNSKKRKRNESELLDDSEEDDQDSNTNTGSPKKHFYQKETDKVEEANEIEDTLAKPTSKKRKATAKDDEESEDEKSTTKKRKVDESQIEDTIRKIRQKLVQSDTRESEGGASSPEKSSKKKNKEEKKNTDIEKKTDVEVETNLKDVAKNITKGKNRKDKIEDIILTPLGLDQKDQKEREDDEEEEEEEEEVPVTMEELFEDEDVVEQFARDKAEEEEKRKPKKEEDVKLPGWGSWTGPDFKDVPKRKPKERRRKFGRREQKQVDKHPNLWLNPNRDKAIRELQPKSVPFPFADAEQYAAAIRQPVSRGFVREVAHKILVKPEVVTKLGHIIQPLNKDDFFRDKNAALDVNDSFGKEIKYTGHVNFRKRDDRLRTQSK